MTALSSLCGEVLKVFGSAGQEKRRTAGLDGPYEVRDDDLVACGVIDKRGIDILNRDVREFWSCPKLGIARDHPMFERACLCHCAGTHAEPSRATLHIDDRMVTVFSRRRRSKTNDVLSLRLLHNLLESERRDMVALVDDHLGIVSWLGKKRS